MTAAAKVRQADAQRLFEAARRAKLRPQRIICTPDGTIEMFLDPDGFGRTTAPALNPWDEPEK